MAEEKDAIGEMNKLLVTKPPVFFWGMLNGINQLQTGPPTATNSYIADAVVLEFENARVNSLPEVVLMDHQVIGNCSGKSSISYNVALSVSASQSWSATKTEGVSTTHGGSIGGSFSFAGVGSNVSFSWNNTVTSSSSVSDGHTDAITRNQGFTVSVEPKAAVDVMLIVYQRTIEVPFHAIAVVDADTIGGQKASSLLSKEERTFPIAGLLRITNVSEGDIRTKDLTGAAGCGDGDQGVVVKSLGQKTLSPDDFQNYIKN